MSTDFDIAVVGSGFGGSLMAMIARRLGRSVVLLERGRHPRFVIGESSTPLANLLLEDLARRYDLPRLLPLTKWGSWRRTYPELACGLKRGFTFYHHKFGQPFANDPGRRDQLLVAASPRDEIADTHWYRADFDHFLIRAAQASGVEYLDQTNFQAVSFQGGKATLRGERDGKSMAICARCIIDATGPQGFLHRALRLPEASFDDFPVTQALYTHFTGVKRWEEVNIPPSGRLAERPPYPMDDAAVHHVFDGGWIWVLRFNNGVTSSGVAATNELANELRLMEGEEAWSRLLDRLPTLREQFRDATPAFPFRHAPRLSFRCGEVVGPGWALLPSAAGFVDPLLSTGFPLTLLGVARLAEILAAAWDSTDLEMRLSEYGEQTLRELDAAARLVGALYATMNDFPLFAALARLYLAAASFSETAHRLNRPQMADGFLLHDHPGFAPQLRSCCQRATRSRDAGGLTESARDELLGDIYRAVDLIDVAGLGDRTRRNWHPANAGDLLNAAGKLKAGESEIREMLVRCGFFPPGLPAAEVPLA